MLRRWTPSTANNRYRGLNAYFNWLLEHDCIPGSPTAKLKPRRLEEKVVPVIDDSELGRVLKQLSGRDFESRRNRAIVSVRSVFQEHESGEALVVV